MSRVIADCIQFIPRFCLAMKNSNGVLVFCFLPFGFLKRWVCKLMNYKKSSEVYLQALSVT